MSKYDDLVRVLDTLCIEAPVENKIYHSSTLEMREKARSLAYIHLFLMAKFGLLTFSEREMYITDGSADGGIDAYYIDKEHKKVYFIQSKFRSTDINFIEKTISYSDLLSMDIDRVTKGEDVNGTGEPYNDKIRDLIKNLQSIDDLGRYTYVVVILANVIERAKDKLERLIGAFPFEIYNHERVYNEILFPVISGSFYDPKELKIVLNINKESSSHRIQYYPETEFGECTVNASFVPTIEIAKTLYKYKNAILKYNPRSYLELTRSSVNEKIASSIIDKQTNEFALFNNGITMLSDETEYSDRVGRRNTAELHLSNPQIINGGQTAYTLSKIYEEALQGNNFEVFEGKEVLLKVISFNDSEVIHNEENRKKKLRLIEEISVATNQQSPVLEADRRANDKVQIELQSKIFEDLGLYYERKRGEFSNGISNGYIKREQLIDREDFLRCCVALKNPVAARRESAGMLFQKSRFDTILSDMSNYKRWIFAYKIFRYLTNTYLTSNGIKYYAKYAIIYVSNLFYDDAWEIVDFDSNSEDVCMTIIGRWNDFEKYVMKSSENQKYYFKEQSREDATKQVDANWQGYYKGRTLQADLDAFFCSVN